MENACVADLSDGPVRVELQQQPFDAGQLAAAFDGHDARLGASGGSSFSALRSRPESRRHSHGMISTYHGLTISRHLEGDITRPRAFSIKLVPFCPHATLGSSTFLFQDHVHSMFAHKNLNSGIPHLADVGELSLWSGCLFGFLCGYITILLTGNLTSLYRLGWKSRERATFVNNTFARCVSVRHFKIHVPGRFFDGEKCVVTIRNDGV